LQSKLIYYEGETYQTIRDNHLLRVQLSGLTVLLIFLRLIQLFYFRFRLKKLLLGAELRTINLSNSETLIFDDNALTCIEYDSRISLNWTYFRGWGISHGFIVFSDSWGFHNSSTMIPFELFTEEQLDFIKQKLPEIK
jgi:hypothetical protein